MMKSLTTYKHHTTFYSLRPGLCLYALNKGDDYYIVIWPQVITCEMRQLLYQEWNDHAFFERHFTVHSKFNSWRLTTVL